MIQYHIVYKGLPPPSEGYVGALRDDSIANKAFFLYANSNSDSLLYDYNLAVGDTVKELFGSFPTHPMVVSTIDSVLISGQYRKRWNLFNNYFNTNSYIIQGIGTSIGLIDQDSYGGDFFDRNLVCVKDSSATIFVSSYNSTYGCNVVLGINEIDSKNEIHFSPNPFSTQTTLQSDVPLNNATLTVLNCFGQTVSQTKNINGKTVTFSRGNLANGIYFVSLTEGNRNISIGKLIISD